MSFPTIGVLGGGQLGRMLVEAGNRLNLQINVLDVDNSPAKQISAHGGHIAGSYTDRASLGELAKNCDILTAEIEHVDTYALEEVAPDAKVEPSLMSIRIIQDKFLQKQHLSQFEIPLAECRELHANSVEELEAISTQLGFPLMLKSKTQAFDGRGNFSVKSKADLAPALEFLKGRPLYAEKWVKYRMELAVIVIKTKDNILSYPIVETVQENSICKLVYAPARNVSDAVKRKAQDLARKVVGCFEGKGVFGVEMFLLHNDTLLICEVASRVHNSGHFTIEGCSLSQFEAHLRAIIDLPIPQESVELRCGSAIMLNILGGSTPDSHLDTARCALSIPNASVHLYSKGAAKPGRKMGHITVTAASMQQAENCILPLVRFVDGEDLKTSFRLYERPSLLATSSSRPTIGVIMGSDSDLKTLVPGLQLLESYFGIKPEVEITSAHRTPDYMATYASSAASRGIKVLIAAAGGAAHLPGMAAAHTSLPVIGVPIKGTSLDGLDSLYSIVQMPRGVPVATVGVNNSVNAALLAARILGAFDAEVQKKVESYAANAARENLELKGAKLKELGWEKYLQEMEKR